MARAAASTAVLKRELNSLSGQSVQTARSQREVESSIGSTGSAAAKGGRELDRYSGRLGILLDLGASVGTGLIPIGAVGIPLVTGLASSLGFTAVAAGAVIASMYGVSDSLKALNAYALKPTDANLQKVEDTLGKLGPDAQDFVLRLRELGPQLKAIRDAGAGELFPHWQETIDSLETLLPDVENLVSRVANKVGQISEVSAQALAGPEWSDFFTFLEQETPHAIDMLAATTGHLAHALAQLWMDFAPINNDFLDVLVSGSKEIDKWATGLSKTQGFQEFLDYIEANGPKVADLIGSIAMGLIQILEAGAPIGSAVLPVLTTLADIVGTIADSDLGTPLLAILALSRGMALLERGTAKPISSVRTLTADLKTMASTSVVAWGRAESETLAYNEAADRTRATLSKVGKAAGALGLLAAASSGATDKVGLTNTALFASAGLMSPAGYWGAAIGGGIGLLLDFAHSQELTTVKAKDLTDQINLQTLALNQQGYAQIGESLSKYQDAIDATGLSLEQVITAAVKGGPALDEVNSAITGYLAGLGPLTANVGDYTSASAKSAEANSTQFTAVQRLREALFGQNTEVDKAVGLAKARATGIAAAASADNRAIGPTRSVAQAIADMGDHTLTTQEKVDALKSSLDALFGPELNLSAARDAVIKNLNDMDKALAKNRDHLLANGDAAIQNRGVIRAQVQAIEDQLVQEAQHGASSKRLTQILGDEREALIKRATALGLNHDQLVALLKQYNLTPKLVETAIKLAGVDDAKHGAKDVKTELDKVGPEFVTNMRVENQQALAAARAVKAALDAIHDKAVTLRVTHVDNFLATHPGSSGGTGTPRTLYPTNPRGLVGSSYASTSSSLVIGQSAKFTPRSVFDTLLQALVGSLAGGNKDIRKALHDFNPTLAKGADEVRSEISSLRHAIHQAGGVWTDAMQRQAKKLIQLAEEHDREKEIAKAFHHFGLSVAQGADGVRSEIADLRRAIRQAGGVWTDAMDRQSKKLIQTAKDYDAAAASLGQLQQASTDFANAVAGSFNTDVIHGNLAQLGSGLTGDISNIDAMQATLDQLKALGLDTTGPNGALYQQLAQSGNLQLAQQLLASGASGIGYYENLFAQRAADQQAFGAGQANTVYGQALKDANDLVTRLATRLDKQQDKLDDVIVAVEHLPQNMKKPVKDGSAEGTFEGITAAAAAAGRGKNRSGG